MQRTASIVVSLTLLTLSAALGGCNMKAAYPQQDGWQQLDPFLDPVPQVVARALDASHAATDPSVPLVWNLPPGMQKTVWNKVSTLLGTGSAAMTKDGERVWSVERVRVNGSIAEVDVLWRNADGLWQLMTVHLEGAAFAPYRVTYLQRWRLPESRVPTCNNPQVLGEAVAPSAPAPAPTAAATIEPSKDAASPNPAPTLVPPATAPTEVPEKP
ncbi:MAG: hypothetical protein FJ254_06555 [Phycisphaerae bacterium]|nr:hypothetical protein [Phycisphaerae bacterium]